MREKQEKQRAIHSPFALVLEQLIFVDLMITVVCAPLAYGTVEVWSIALFELNGLLLAVLLALKLALAPQEKLHFPRILLPLLALLLLGIGQTVPLRSIAANLTAPESVPLAQLGPPTLSLDPYATREATIKLLALIIYFLVAINVLPDRERRRGMLVVITVLGFAVSLFGIIQRLTWNGKIYWVRPLAPGMNPFGPFINPNHFAGMIELILPLALAQLLFARMEREQRALWLFASVVMTAAVILSLSRGGMLALGVELIAFFIIGILSRRRAKSEAHGRRLLQVRGALLPFALAAVAVMTLWIGYDQLAVKWQAARQGSREVSLAKRLEIWRDSWQMFRNHPIWGVGLGAYPTAYPFYGRSSAERERVEQAHNDYLQLLTDGGLVGAVIGLWFLIELLIAVRRQWRAPVATRSLERSLTIGGSVAVIGLLVHSFTDFNLQITSNALLFLLAIAFATSLDSTAS